MAAMNEPAAASATSIAHDATKSGTQLLLETGELGLDIYSERGTLSREGPA